MESQMKVNGKLFTDVQTKVIWACILSYCTAYFCRLNLSAALNAIVLELDLTKTQGGALATVFAAVYAFCQLVNGSIVNKVNPMKYMLLGLVGSACANIAISFSNTYVQLLICCLANAVFQSMMWTPIMRMQALFFTEKRPLDRANRMVSYTLVVGHFGAWLISGFMAERLNWHLSFSIPGILALVMAVTSYIMTRGICFENSGRNSSKQSTGAAKGIWKILFETGFLYILASALIFGFVRDSNITWAPTILNDMVKGLNISSAAVSLLLPIVNIAGTAVGYKMRSKGLKPSLVVSTMMAFVIACAVILIIGKNVILTALLLSFVCAAMSGAGPMFTTIFPLEYNFANATGFTAGMIDCTIYMGSALAGVLGGFVMDNNGVASLFIIWILTSAIAVVLMKRAAICMSMWHTKNDY